MDIRALRYVVTLAEELHFGRAAGRHFISAQPFGQQVQRLERELGVRLFERTSRRVSLTPAGARFVDRARMILAELDQLRQIAVEEDRRAVGSLRVGVLGFGIGDRWEALRCAVDVQQQDLPLEYRDLDLVDQYDALRRGDVDVAIVQFVGDLDGLDLQPVLASPRVAVLPASSALSEASYLTVGDLDGVPWLDVATREPMLRSWMGPAADADALSVRHPAGIPTAVATTGRVSLHAAAAAQYYPRPDVRFVPVEGPPVRVALATRTGDDRPTVAAFRRAAAVVRAADAVWPLADTA
ncbi:LysR family transcriptional regulator [Nocardioides pocheonensis]|uniref:LysR family transcriptional regulator n=1 Tax=Nocardioides pocheonensis TaxID=661485 RepID=A0A3N0GNB5_9ACTN|nr:LysR family transcriptional regulator [Nocardioides pocheonensis]RNM13917.1 LysR family transcriptional regulator [Nocardioides pocheonensis]